MILFLEDAKKKAKFFPLFGKAPSRCLSLSLLFWLMQIELVKNKIHSKQKNYIKFLRLIIIFLENKTRLLKKKTKIYLIKWEKSLHGTNVFVKIEKHYIPQIKFYNIEMSLTVKLFKKLCKCCFNQLLIQLCFKLPKKWSLS